MKYAVSLTMVLLILLAGCEGGKDKPLSGTVTITSELFGTGPYYAFGYSFSRADKVSTLDLPGPDVTVGAGDIHDDGVELIESFLGANTLEPPFALMGEYGTETAAVTAFNALTSAGTPQWKELGSPLRNYQVWVIRTREGKYAKIVTTDVTLNKNVTPAFASCTFRWVYQPDGSSTFPGS